MWREQEHARRFQHDRGIRGLHECVFCYCDTVCLLPLLVLFGLGRFFNVSILFVFFWGGGGVVFLLIFVLSLMRLFCVGTFLLFDIVCLLSLLVVFNCVVVMCIVFCFVFYYRLLFYWVLCLF